MNMFTKITIPSEDLRVGDFLAASEDEILTVETDGSDVRITTLEAGPMVFPRSRGVYVNVYRPGEPAAIDGDD